MSKRGSFWDDMFRCRLKSDRVNLDSDAWSCPFGGEALLAGSCQAGFPGATPRTLPGLQGCNGEVARTKVEIRSRYKSHVIQAGTAGNRFEFAQLTACCSEWKYSNVPTVTDPRRVDQVIT